MIASRRTHNMRATVLDIAGLDRPECRIATPCAIKMKDDRPRHESERARCWPPRRGHDYMMIFEIFASQQILATPAYAYRHRRRLTLPG